MFQFLSDFILSLVKSGAICAAFIFLLFSTSCITVDKPDEEYNLAKAALDSARDNDGNRFALKFLILAEKHYKKAITFYKDRDYDNARKFFLLSKKYSEKTEDISRIKQLEGGNE